MNRVRTGTSKSEFYGNNFTSYRIWDAILNSSVSTEILKALSKEE
jgi:hypothetical protein